MPDDVYTHGHHDSRAALAPVADGGQLRRLPAAAPAPGHDPARHRLRTRHHHRSTWPAPWRRAGWSASTRPPTRWTSPGNGRGARATRRRVRHRRRLRPRPARRLVRRRPRAPGAPAPQRPGGRAARDAPGLPARRARRRAGRRLRGDDLVPRGSAGSTSGSTSTSRSPAATTAEPDAGRRLLAWAHAAGFADVTRRRHAGATPPRRSGTGGRGAGPTGPRRRTSPCRPATGGSPPMPTSAGSPTPGGSGARTRTGGWCWCTARCSQPADLHAPGGRVLASTPQG